jgi:hypothetical protein
VEEKEEKYQITISKEKKLLWFFLRQNLWRKWVNKVIVVGTTTIQTN